MAPARNPRRPRARLLWLTVHRWLGLGLLLAWLMLGATGSVLVVYRELLNATRAPAELAGTTPPTLSPDRALQTLRAAEPDRHGPWRLEWPLADGDPVVARYMRPHESQGRAFAPLMVWLVADGSRVQAQQLWGQEPLTWLYDLHYSLLLDQPGRQAVGVLGVLCTVSLVSGLVLWWPRPGQWRQALRFKRQTSVQRRVYDLHKLTGLGFAVIGLMLTVTGALMTWQKPLERALSGWTPLFASPSGGMGHDVGGGPTGNRGALSSGALRPASRPAGAGLDAALRQALARFPAARPRWIESPGHGSAGLIRVQLWQAGEPSRRFPRTQVWVSSQDGAIVAVRDGLRDHPADATLAWLHPLHNGEAFGWAGRIVVLLSGLMPWVLGVTGVWRWWHKRRARQGRP